MDDDKKLQELVMRAWDDADFKAKLFADPATTMRGMGIDIPDGMEIQVTENTAEKATLVLPPRPEGELSEDELMNVAGGFTDPGFAPGRRFRLSDLPGSIGSIGSVGGFNTFKKI